MYNIQLKLIDRKGRTQCESETGDNIYLVHKGKYHKGDTIHILCDTPGVFCEIQLEDTIRPSLVYLRNGEGQFIIPFGEGRVSYSPRSFVGKKHLITARVAYPEEMLMRRNLALNPYDTLQNNGMYPHVEANAQTRGRAMFAARNVIDGIYASHKHGFYPYHSWGINRNPLAELKLEFGRPVVIDEVRLTLRADFPHDSYWEQATVAFSDGSSEILRLQKTGKVQSFSVAARTIEGLVVKDLKKAEDPSPFPALKQLEAWGRESIAPLS